MTSCSVSWGNGVYLAELSFKIIADTNFDQAEALMIAASKAGLHLESVGKFGGADVSLGNVKAPMADLSATYRNSFADTFA